MVETRRTGDRNELPIRTDTGGYVGVGPNTGARAAEGAGRHVPRIPTMRMLASLLVNGVLRLPMGYRRGMFLDLFV